MSRRPTRHAQYQRHRRSEQHDEHVKQPGDPDARTRVLAQFNRCASQVPWATADDDLWLFSALNVWHAIMEACLFKVAESSGLSEKAVATGRTRWCASGSAESTCWCLCF
eukprot:TRINITY_DN38778_c0_g1_i2.p1 TRINITY_DN38778_c0_g1~~TRINITY_DN38778_c0_g1_i2.p1  ORF type:complete len:110 (+),score=6.78 TRINITY_DN38778_c0_g1_i2:20-349(+)